MFEPSRLEEDAPAADERGVALGDVDADALLRRRLGLAAQGQAPLALLELALCAGELLLEAAALAPRVVALPAPIRAGLLQIVDVVAQAVARDGHEISFFF